MKKGYILFFTLILLSCVSILMGGLHLMRRTQTLWMDQYIREQSDLLTRYSIRKLGIPPAIPLQLKDGFDVVHVVK